MKVHPESKGNTQFYNMTDEVYRNWVQTQLERLDGKLKLSSPDVINF